MNLQRIHELYNSTAALSGSDADSLKQLCRDYPFFAKPYVLLARHYHNTQHYKFEETLRQAAMRVKDRKALYTYIHGLQHTDEAETHTDWSVSDDSNVVSDGNTDVKEIDLSPTEPVEKPGISAFLEDLSEPELQAVETGLQETSETNPENHVESFIDALDGLEAAHPEVQLHSSKPTEFEFMGAQLPHAETQEDSQDIIGEEIHTEFSFSKRFATARPEDTEPDGADADHLQHPETIPETQPETTESGALTLQPDTEAFLKDFQDDHVQIATEQPQSDSPDLNLRKYPVYNLETAFADKDTQTDEAPLSTEMTGTETPELSNHLSSEENDTASGMDFLAWLSKPKPDIVYREQTDSRPQHDDNASDDLKSLTEDKDTDTPAVPNKTLDIIERFIQVNPQISRPKKEFFNAENMAKKSEVPDLDFVSETLANIYYEQGNFDMALRAYEKLSLQNPSKQAYFADLIEKIKKERK